MAAVTERCIASRLAGQSPDPRPGATMRFSYHCRGIGTGSPRGQEPIFSAVLSPEAGPRRHPQTRASAGPTTGPCAAPGADLAAIASFLTDSAFGSVPLATLARMIGSCAFACGAATVVPLDITLSNSHGALALVRLAPPRFEIERTAFGAAHILHEDDTLGLYVLEIAPGRSIPAHSHQIMREWELILDEGLWQQNRPVPRGAAFAWPLGYVHSYSNSTPRPLRILCIDSPRFNPADEVPLSSAPPLAPREPFAEYPV